MRRLLITMYRLFFYQRINYWLVVTALLLSASSLLMPRGLAMPVRFLAIALVTSFPLFAVVMQFSGAASNRHFAAVPYGRHFLLGATFCLTLILSALFSLNFSRLPMSGLPEFTEVFPVFFFACSFLAMLASGNIKSYLLIPIIFAFVFHESVLAFWQQLPGIKVPILFSGLAFISILGWSWLAFKLHRTGSINGGMYQSLRPDPEQSSFARVGRKMADLTQLLGVQTLVYRLPCSRGTRFWSMASHMLFLFALGTGYMLFFVDPLAWGELLLISQLPLIMALPITVAEWAATLRVLWLKVPGDRLQFWRLWKKLFQNELLLSIVMLGVYGLVIGSIFEVPSVALVLYVVMVVFLLPSMCFFAVWFRLNGAFDSNRAVWSGVVYLSAVIVLIVATFATEVYAPVTWLAFLSGSIGLLAYFRVRSGFLTLDWLQVRSRS